PCQLDSTVSVVWPRGVLTPLVRMAARRFGFVAKPKIDRWHKKPTAMMGGLATGIAAIASGFLTLNFITSNQTTDALMLAVFAAALLGFLIYNSNPASIFMGDSGSMFIGFFLASSALINVAGGRSRSFVPVLAVPILVLFIPIFDTTFVTILRKLSGRAASQGGRDHTSHRLVALGLSEKRAVLMLYGLAALSGVLAVGVRQFKPDVSIALLVI